MSRFVRASKVRHVFCHEPKEEHCYRGFKLSAATSDHSYIKANTKYVAIPIHQGNGSLAVINIDMKDRRFDTGVLPCLDGHRGPVLSFDFNPFQEQLIASGGDDCVAKVWGIPKGGLTESISESLADLVGHDKKVTCLLHHPTAEFVIATGSADRTVKIWDVEKQEEQCSLEHGEILQGLAWDSTGETLASTCRDKMLRLIDPRTGQARETINAHDGQRTMKAVFCPNKGPGNNEVVCTVGFTRQSKRQFRLWDQRNLKDPYASHNIDQAAGALLPFYCSATNLLYLAGKGDANIRYFELVDGKPWQFYISEYRSKEPSRGTCILPERILDVTKCEVASMMKLTPKKIIPLSFICPRKSDLFQADLYPDAYAGKTSLKAGDFFEGKKGVVLKVSMDPKKKKTTGGGESAASTGITKKKNRKELETELKAANERIKTLENLLKEKNIKF